MIQEIRALLTARKLLVASCVASRLKVGAVSKDKFEARIHELVAGRARLGRIVGPLLRARAAMEKTRPETIGGLQDAIGGWANA
jgi:transposase